ncbi:MAG: hypothetical protein MAG795_01200 [Candidatus Woesearchaeota archaeon]|nr:hypothetical protein [Candidatus Woesearchaeota archaeon]
MLQFREKEIFESIKKLGKNKFVIIGGYAVSAYTFPRFSVDCDIVVKEESEAKSIEELLVDMQYKKVSDNFSVPYKGYFHRFEKKIEQGFIVSMDVLIREVLDRQTNSVFSAAWIFDNSRIKTLRGKTITKKIKSRIIDIDALFVMKMISCRSTDIRDLFMLAPDLDNLEWVKQEVSKRYELTSRHIKIKEKVESKQFRDGLQGVFGRIDDELFEKHMQALLSVKD